MLMEIGPVLHALSRNKVGAMLIALQIALTMAVVTNAAFIIRQRADAIARPTGMDEENTFFVVTNAFRTGLDYRKMRRDDLDAIKQIPGVRAVTPIGSVPASGGGWGDNLYLDRKTPSTEAITLGFFTTNEDGLAALGIELVAGRNFTPEEVKWNGPDSKRDLRTILISQAVADELFPGGSAVGKLVWDEPNSEEPTEIIGVYRHMMNAWPQNEEVNSSAILPMIDEGSEMRFFVRAEAGQRDQVMQKVEEYLAQNHDRMVRIVRTIEDQLQRTYSSDIAMVKILTGVVIILSTVTGLGIVGMAWFSVSQRRKQIGTRRALGARRADIIRYFMVENWLVTSMGLVLGIAGAFMLNWVLDTEYQTGRMPLYYLPMGVMLLWLLGQVAVLIPAQRAAGIPPALATRSV
jgi:putative ABC transport system permease protein